MSLNLLSLFLPSKLCMSFYKWSFGNNFIPRMPFSNTFLVNDSYFMITFTKEIFHLQENVLYTFVDF